MLKIYLNLTAYFKRKQVNVDSPIFCLSTNYTAFIIFLFCFVLTSTEIFVKNGKPIKCSIFYDGSETGPDPKDLQKAIESYCWIKSTYTLPTYTSGKSGLLSYPGIPGSNYNTNEVEQNYASYYQWTTFILFLQSLLCCFPWWIWNFEWEKGLLQQIVQNLNVSWNTEQDVLKRKKALVNYLKTHLTMHMSYSIKYWICECLAFFNIIGQMIFLDRFFQGEFRHFGSNFFKLLDYIDEDPTMRTDPFIYIFPRVTKCGFRKFGPSQGLEIYDVLCILNLNSTNERVYIFIWFWYVAMFILLGLLLMYRLFIIILPSLRTWLIGFENKLVPVGLAKMLTKSISVTDWWIFYALKGNLDPVTFSDVLIRFTEEISGVADKAGSEVPLVKMRQFGSTNVL